MVDETSNEGLIYFDIVYRSLFVYQLYRDEDEEDAMSIGSGTDNSRFDYF